MDKLKESAPYWVTLAVSVYLYYSATQISAPDTGNQLGPDFWPKAVLGLMILVCVYAIGRIMLFGRRGATVTLDDELESEAAAKDSYDIETEPEKRYPLLLIAGTAITVLYVVLFNTLGFFLDTFIYMTAFILIGRYRRIWVAVLVSLIGSLIFMFVFMKIVYVSLPLGTPPFSQVSILLMQLMGIR
jgi:putative tricarboxylic transport membrane protein